MATGQAGRNAGLLVMNYNIKVFQCWRCERNAPEGRRRQQRQEEAKLVAGSRQTPGALGRAEQVGLTRTEVLERRVARCK